MKAMKTKCPSLRTPTPCRTSPPSHRLRRRGPTPRDRRRARQGKRRAPRLPLLPDAPQGKAISQVTGLP
eukprot:14839915-Alexandrium_andersonii.AAC.1